MCIRDRLSTVNLCGWKSGRYWPWTKGIRFTAGHEGCCMKSQPLPFLIQIHKQLPADSTVAFRIKIMADSNIMRVRAVLQQIVDCGIPVSYTHLDVYKRQQCGIDFSAGRGNTGRSGADVQKRYL